MVKYLVKAEARHAVEIYEAVKAKIGVLAATKWFFSSNVWLGCVSPLQALKAGRYHDVKVAAMQRMEQ